MVIQAGQVRAKYGDQLRKGVPANGQLGKAHFVSDAQLPVSQKVKANAKILRYVYIFSLTYPEVNKIIKHLMLQVLKLFPKDF